jgi:hypothetical protein
MYTGGTDGNGENSAMNEDYLAKMNAIAYISMRTGFGRPRVEKALKRLKDEGRIHPIAYPNTILYSPSDIELIIKVLKGEVE